MAPIIPIAVLFNGLIACIVAFVATLALEYLSGEEAEGKENAGCVVASQLNQKAA